MPTYEYECKKCGHNFEAFQSMSDDPLKKCQKCGKEVRRLIFGGAGVIFKGSGFYVTDKSGVSSAFKSSSDETKPSETVGKTEGGCGGCQEKKCPAAATAAAASKESGTRKIA